MTWRPMTEHVFPWPVKRVIVAAFPKDDRSGAVAIQCRVGEHGALFECSRLLSIHEEGWIPYAWREDDTPHPDDVKWPPLWKDYLTGWEEDRS